MNNDDSSKIDRLQSALYSRRLKDKAFEKKSVLHEKDIRVNNEWQHDPVMPVENSLSNNEKSHKFMVRILMGSVAFFIIAVAVGLYILFNGAGATSGSNVDITVVGPATVKAGDAVSFEINVINRNSSQLELVDVAIEYPEGTANPNNVAEELRRYRELIGDIQSGQSGSKKVRAIFFGEENSKKEIKISAEYRLPGSNAILVKEKTYEIYITSSPLSVTIDSFKEINTGQQFEMVVTVTSNSPTVVKNLLLDVKFPFGFTLASANPLPAYGNNTWKIGDLPPGGKRTISLYGKLDGQDDETRIFRFATGIQSTRDERQIGTPFITSTRDIVIKKPFLAVKFSLDSESVKDHVVGNGDTVRGEIEWKNNLATSIVNAEIRAHLIGDIYDKSSVKSNDGFYNSLTNSIEWNMTNTSGLAEILPGQTGRVMFTISLHSESTSRNPEMSINVSVGGKRPSEQNVPEEVTSSVTRVIKLVSQPQLVSHIMYSNGVFTNRGPYPPKAEQETTYTVMWTIVNTSSNIGNVLVTAQLPLYVKWLNVIKPTQENIRYNPVDGKLSWDAGTIAAGARKEVSFQISLTPSLGQVGEAPRLVQEITLNAIDQFTGTKIRLERGELTTRLTNDVRFENELEVVTQ